MVEPEYPRWNPSQIVAYNMTKARELRGVTQTEVAERLSRFTESKWTKTSVAQAEGSVTGSRVRAFTAVELVALARTFDLPVTYFLAPPDDRSQTRLDLPDVPDDAWDYLVLLVAGHYGNKELLGERYADYIHSENVDVPIGDVSEDEISEYVQRFGQTRTRLSPTDVYAAGFHGLLLRNMRGAPRPGEKLSAFIDSLQDLIFALKAFDSYDPGEFIDPKPAEGLASERADE